jgi:hypothetical protein
MKLFLKRNSPVFYMLLAMIELYAPWMGRGYVNFEYPFSMAARALSDSRYTGQIDTYFAVQANPLGYSFVLAIIYKIFGYHDWFWLAKLPSLCGGLMIIVSGWILTRDRWHDRHLLFYFWSSLIILNPLFFAFATSSTADVLQVGLLMLAIAIAYENKHESWVKPLIASLIFGLAIITKYVPIYFGAAFIAIAVLDKTESRRSSKLIRRDIAIYVLVPGVILSVYIWWLYAKYSVFISYGYGPGKPNFFDVPKFLITFSKYLVFLGICLGPLPLFINLNSFRHKKRQFFGLITVLAAIILGVYISKIKVDEMDFGGGFPFGIIMLRGIQTVGFVLGLNVLSLLLKSVRSSDRLERVLLLGFLPSLVMISFTFPTQRYVMVVVPGALILVVDASGILSSKLRNLTLGVTALGFAAVSLLGLSYLRGQGNASENMAVWMERNYVIDQTSAFPISVHAGQHFYGLTPNEIRYEVYQTSLEGEKLIKERILHREPMNVLGKITRVYVLRELPKAP